MPLASTLVRDVRTLLLAMLEAEGAVRVDGQVQARARSAEGYGPEHEAELKARRQQAASETAMVAATGSERESELLRALESR
eukprot:8894514-Pyramimonas_sp.AAC.1